MDLSDLSDQAPEQKYPYDLNKFASAKETLRLTSIWLNLFRSIDDLGIVVLRINQTFGLSVVPMCTQLIWESDEPYDLNILGNLCGS